MIHLHGQALSSQQQMDQLINDYLLTSIKTQSPEMILEKLKGKMKKYEKQSTKDAFLDSTMAGLIQIVEIDQKLPKDSGFIILHIVLTNAEDSCSQTSREAISTAFRQWHSIPSQSTITNHIIGIDIQSNSAQDTFLHNLADIDMNLIHYQNPLSPKDINVKQILSHSALTSVGAAASIRKKQSHSNAGSNVDSVSNSIVDMNNYLEKPLNLDSSTFKQNYLIVFNVQIATNMNEAQKNKISCIVELFLQELGANDLITFLLIQPDIFKVANPDYDKIIQSITNRNLFSYNSNIQSELSLSVRQDASTDPNEKLIKKETVPKDNPCICNLI